MTSAFCKVKPRCVVGLFGSPMLGGTLYGLTVSSGTVEIDAKSFPCCDGSGLLYHDEQQASSRCTIQRNIANVKSVYRQLAGNLGRDLFDYELRALNAQLAAPAHAKLISMRNGHLLASTTDPKIDKNSSVSAFWVMALAAAWRYGLSVDLANFGKQSLGELSRTLSGIDHPQLIAVCGLHKLSDPGYADAFEALVSNAYHSRVPILIEAPSVKQAAAKPQSLVAGFSAKGIFKQRAEELRRQHPLQFLQKDCLSRLQEILGTDLKSAFEGL